MAFDERQIDFQNKTQIHSNASKTKVLHSKLDGETVKSAFPLLFSIFMTLIPFTIYERDKRRHLNGI